jgi:uncharacterized protein with GYD domain
MQTYILLMKLTEQGARDIKNAPARIREALQTFESMGGKPLGIYLVTGAYDYVAIGEAPSDEVAVTFALGLAAQGNVTTATLRAFTLEQVTAMVQKL